MIARMTWIVLFHDAFDAEFSDLKEDLQDELLAHARLLAEFGPNLGRHGRYAQRVAPHQYEGVALLVERSGLASGIRV